jgi:PAS domain S-box-containing protein
MAALSRLAEHAPAYFGYLDADLRYLFVNNQYEELVMVPKERLIGKLVREIVGRKSFARLKPQFEIALSGRSTNFDTDYADCPGGKHTLRHHIWPEIGPDGIVHGLYVFIHELTETDRIKDELLAKERRLLGVLKATHIIPWEADPQTWQFTYVGPQAETMLGYSIDRWYEKDFWTSNIFSEDREFAINYCETRSRKPGDFEFEYRMVKADGELIWLRDIVSAAGEDSVPQVLRGFMIDITKAKLLEETYRKDRDQLELSFDSQSMELESAIRKTEHVQSVLQQAHDERTTAIQGLQKLERVLAAAPDAIVITDGTGVIVFAAGGLERLFGYQPEEVVGSDIQILLPERFRRRHRMHFDKFVRKPRLREMGSGIELFALRKDCSEFPVEVSINPMQSEGHILISSVVRDITERKALQLSAEKRAADLARSNKVLTARESECHQKQQALHELSGRLIAAQEEERRRLGRELHDDLTQHLAVLAIDAGQLEQQAETAEAWDIDRLHRIREQLTKLSEYVHSLSRQLHPAIVEELGLVAALRSMCEEVAHNDRVLIVYQSDSIPTDIPNAIALCMYRVAQEAVRNIVKHAHATQANVHLQSINGMLQLQVTDNGIGFNVNKAEKPVGLGLHSIDERVSLVGGSLRVESSGDGTVLSVNIPLA